MPARPRPFRCTALLATLTLLLAEALSAFAADDRTPHRETTQAAPIATVLGAMNDFDQFGVQVQYYLGRGRVSMLASVAYLTADPDLAELPKGAVFTGGARVFTRGLVNRGYLELSWGPIARGFEARPGMTRKGIMIYGPNLLLGYERVATSGLTVLAGGGLGYGRGVNADHWSLELRFGVGYTLDAAHREPKKRDKGHSAMTEATSR